MSQPPRRDPRSEPGDVPIEEHLGRAPGRRPGSQPRSTEGRPGSGPPPGDEEPRSDTRPLADSAEEDLLGNLAAQLLREERGRRAAEDRVRTLEEDLSRADALRDRAVDELRGHVARLRQELADSELHRADLLADRERLEQALAEANADIVALRARRSPSVRAMAALRQSQPPSPPADASAMAAELDAVRRTADDAIAALKDLIQRKEVVLAEGRAILERLAPAERPTPIEPTLRSGFGSRVAVQPIRGVPRPSSFPTPSEGSPVPTTEPEPERGDWPELIFDDDKGR